MHDMKLSCIDILWTKRKNIHKKVNKMVTKKLLNAETLANKELQGFLHAKSYPQPCGYPA